MQISIHCITNQSYWYGTSSLRFQPMKTTEEGKIRSMRVYRKKIGIFSKLGTVLQSDISLYKANIFPLFMSFFLSQHVKVSHK